ncbi:2OG-Fe(II) oxygenase [Acetobacter oeni]|uniref:Prolyl 4-hydroxylase alpha subunit Fe(2+) 2OG dioxygenase domain-containing protein n=1 Tax=Acetobacter oeni TaxID=304077 RepID=A0A511XKE5_9PROT|nr:2OG-Fe(II) oxygenase [Acetobacter oeni]MBB3883835.1 hypothetical protein [Acetobacter oeni]NHO19764.1 2OG-Fe(II) oxygenase [Acetobacter oeni]GBR03615.1 hypothetical protein AA21952_1111 [Acetobacter oeni LMG 21952]GEN63410.1 hypothetical protein AOE01nite_16340 [Acetobacter oeni]
MSTKEFLSSAAAQANVPLWCSPSSTEAQTLAKTFEYADPFPHLVLDGLFEQAFLKTIADEIHSLRSDHWVPHYTALQKKRATDGMAGLPPQTARYFAFTNSSEFIFFLESITGIHALMPDSTLLGGGIHQANANGHFEIHVDFQTHPTTGFRNRVAVITYLNTDWTEADGGALELWNMEENRAAVSILPLFGRTVIMGQSTIAAHGYPTALPGERPRLALIAYFYTQTSNPLHTAFNKTRYFRRPDMPLNRRVQIALRDIFPTPVVRSLRQLQSQLTHRRNK